MNQNETGHNSGGFVVRRREEERKKTEKSQKKTKGKINQIMIQTYSPKKEKGHKRYCLSNENVSNGQGKFSSFFELQMKKIGRKIGEEKKKKGRKRAIDLME